MIDSEFLSILKSKFEQFHKTISEFNIDRLKENFLGENKGEETEIPLFSQTFSFRLITEIIKEEMRPSLNKISEIIKSKHEIKKLSSTNTDFSDLVTAEEIETISEQIIIDSHSNVAINSSSETEQWEVFFHKYYVDASENYFDNYDNYLNTSLKLINHFPDINWESEIYKKSVTLFNQKSGKKTLILDLDETLIHSDLDFAYTNHDNTLIVNFEEESNLLIPLFIRPYLKEFLEYAATNFELICFTASCKNYADAVLDYLEKDKKYFSHRLYRDSCLFLHPGIYIKDLRIFKDLNLADVAIVDNSLFSFANQLSNGVLISSFFNDKNDEVLNTLITYLNEYILESSDVREINRELFQFENQKQNVKNVDGS